MSKKRTLSVRTLNNQHVVDVLDEQTGNLTQHHSTKRGAYRQIHAILSEVGKDAIRCLFSGGGPCRPDFDIPDWRQNFANEVEEHMIKGGFKSLIPTYIEEIMKKFPKAVGGRAESEWCYCKIAYYCGQVASMITYKLDPELLTASPKEKLKGQLALIDFLINHQKPFTVISV
jgi:hypothetical protein